MPDERCQVRPLEEGTRQGPPPFASRAAVQVAGRDGVDVLGRQAEGREGPDVIYRLFLAGPAGGVPVRLMAAALVERGMGPIPKTVSHPTREDLAYYKKEHAMYCSYHGVKVNKRGDQCEPWGPLRHRSRNETTYYIALG